MSAKFPRGREHSTFWLTAYKDLQLNFCFMRCLDNSALCLCKRFGEYVHETYTIRKIIHCCVGSLVLYTILVDECSLSAPLLFSYGRNMFSHDVAHRSVDIAFLFVTSVMHHFCFEGRN